MATVRVVTAKNGSEAAGAWLNDRAAKLVLVLPNPSPSASALYAKFSSYLVTTRLRSIVNTIGLKLP